MKTDKQIFVMALGGSIIHPDEIDISYLKDFYDFILKEIAEGKKFIIVTGGGALCRKFQKAAGEFVHVSDEDKDWLGIHSTRLNAQLLRTIFIKQAHPVILKKRGKITDFDGYSIIIAAGWPPGGWSTDFVAVQIAVDFGLGEALILGKPEYVYDKDNQKFPDAKPFEKISWSEYLKLIPNEWSPGIHAPLDPIAAKLAQKENLKVIVAGGKDLENVKKILNNQDFKGTIIE
jgi:uridylate kinase